MDVGITDKNVCCVQMAHRLNFEIFNMKMRRGDFMLIN